MEKQLSASIMTANQMELADEIQRLKEHGVNRIHCDVMDGIFVNNLAMGPYLIETLKKDTSLILDVHLATETPERFISMFGPLNPDYLTFHVEATDNPGAIIDLIQQFDCKVGIALSPETSFDTVLPYVDNIDLLLVMTVNPGFAGQRFNLEVLKKLKIISSFLEKKSNRPIIQVDGNINKETIRLMKGNLVDVFILGTSALYNDNNQSFSSKINLVNEEINSW